MNQNLRVLVAQANATVGALKLNYEKAISIIQKGHKENVDIIVFPELFLTGYPPQDLILDQHFIKDNTKYVEKLAREVSQTIVIIGAIHRDKDDTYNAAAVIQNGAIIKWIHKSLLPTYDVFDEWRYFKPGRDNEPVEVSLRSGKTLKLGIHICEDLWDKGMDYKVCDILGDKGVDLFINLSASPFHYRKQYERGELLLAKVNKYKKPYVYVNLVGGQDELVFDGESLIADGRGRWLHIGSKFKEELAIVNIAFGDKAETSEEKKFPGFPMERELFEALVLGVRDYFYKTGHRDAVLGLSGGIDSAVTAAIAVEALGNEHVTGVAMPSQYSSDHSVNDAELLAKNLGIRYEKVPINDLIEAFQNNFNNSIDEKLSGIAEENLQARIRGNILMSFSNKDGSLLLTTGNKTEIALGYCTLYGDMSGGLAVISDLGKKEVYAIASHFNMLKGYDVIPENTITKAPSAELRFDQVDPFDYDIISPIVNDIIERQLGVEQLIAKGYPQDIVHDMVNKIRNSEYKRQQMPPGIRVTQKAFGMGRRMPIVNHYSHNEHKF